MARIYDGITPPQEQFLLALCLADSLADAARTTKTAETTARRWMRRPEMRAAWLDMRRQMTETAMMAIQRATALAGSTLVACMAAKMPPAVRLQAAKAVLEFNLRSIEVGELAQRIELLEEALEDAKAEQQKLDIGGRRYA